MHHIHYLTLTAVALELQSRLGGGRILGAFSQERHELVLHYRHRRADGYLRVRCSGPLPFCLPTDHFARAGRNTVDCLPGVIQARVLRVGVPLGEREIWMALEPEGYLCLRLHGAQGNVLWLDAAGRVQDRFRRTVARVDALPPPRHMLWADALAALAVTRQLATEATLEAQPSQALAALTESPAFAEWAGAQDWAARIPWLDDWLRQDLAETQGQSVGETLSPERVQQWLRLRATGRDWYAWADESAQPTRLRFSFAPPAYPVLAEPRPLLDALDYFVRTQLSRWQFDAQYRQLQERLAQARHRAERALVGAQRGLAEMEAARPPEELGHLLMANVHAIEPGAEAVELDDWYTGQRLRLRLDPALTAVQQAQQHYARQRARQQRMTHLRAQIPLAEAQLAALAALEPKLRAARRLADLRKIEAAHPQLQARQPPQAHAAILPYRVFYFQGYEIRVGKNARSNDALTFGHSRANDLWLHARGVAGSHVILRRAKAQPVPRPVREYAASLAAGHSQAQHSGLVPVIVTPRKFVRKNKRMAPGQVIVSREEEVLLVPPSKG